MSFFEGLVGSNSTETTKEFDSHIANDATSAVLAWEHRGAPIANIENVTVTEIWGFENADTFWFAEDSIWNKGSTLYMG